MSVIGFDIGNVNCVIAAAKHGGIDVLLNDEAKRETPAVVSFGDKQRFLGSAGAAFATANPKSTISQIKRLIGRQYKEPSVQEELKLLPFATSEGPRGGILIELEYMKEKLTFTPVEILGMLFKHLKQIAEKNIESAVVDCVIGIPSYFTDLQRREYLDAATIAGLRPLRLMHDGTAIALGYGMYKTDLLDSGPTNVIFVDIGHCDTQVTVAAFEQGKMDILSHSFDQNLGGRDFDEVLFKHFSAQFLEQYQIDVYSNASACIRLRASCEKLKKVLSANTEAPLSIECLIEDKDVRGIITREEFENLSQQLLGRVTIPCLKAIEDSRISVDKIYTIELVGSGSRIPAITKILTSLFQKEPTRTLNASECVARGCALRSAMLSPTLQVRNYEVKDLFPYSIAIPFHEQEHQELMLFPKGILFPNTRLLTHNGGTSFYFQVLYTNLNDLPAGVSPLVGHFKIGQNKSSASEKVKVEFVVMLNHHGIFEIKSASVSTDECPSQQKMVTNSHIAFSENLDVATTKDELLEAQEREQMFAEQDKKVEQTKDQRNTLKYFVYDTRSKLKSAYKRVVTDLENEGITKRLQETEEWLYESDDESDEQDYAVKLDGLKKLLEPIENRYKDENKAQAKKPLLAMIEEYRSVADSLQPRNKKETNVMRTDQGGIKDFGVSENVLGDRRTNYKLSETQVTTQMLAEKDIQVEQTKENIHASKALYYHNDEFKEADSGKLGNPVQLSGPVENKNKDENAREQATKQMLNKVREAQVTKQMPAEKDIQVEQTKEKIHGSELSGPVENKNKDENAREQAIKAMLTCLEEYRLVAGSLPPSQKEEVNIECNRVEQWLNDLSQQNLSNKNINPIRWSNIIKNAMESFERRCKHLMN